jgi:hypothetical protein
MKVLQKLMFWRSDAEAEATESLPNSGPNDPEIRPQTPEEKAESVALERERRAEQAENAEGERPDDTT